MKHEELDRAMSEDGDIVPSSGFVAAVMEAVTAEATAPPLRFPWERAWPLAAGFLALLLWLAFLQFAPEVATPQPDLYAWFETIVPVVAGWVAGGPLMTVAVTGGRSGWPASDDPCSFHLYLRPSPFALRLLTFAF